VEIDWGTTHLTKEGWLINNNTCTRSVFIWNTNKSRREFEEKKVKLWNLINTRLLISKFREELENKNHIVALRYLTSSFFSSPITFIKIIFNKLFS